MPLLIGYDPAGLEAKTRSAIDAIVSSLQAWAAQVDGVNAAERLSQLTAGVASLPTVQPGTILPFGGASTSIPTGYLYCDGTAVSRTTYANLFAAIGTTWGAGDGSTTFNVPDGRGRYFLGKASSGTGSTLGGTFGAIDHTHTGPSHTHSGPSHTHSISSGGSHTHTISGSTASESSHTHSFSGTTEKETAIVISTDGAYDQSVGDDPHHQHDFSGTTGAGSSHSHSAGTLGADSGGSHDHGADTGSGGTGDTGAGGTGATGTANPPSFVGNWMVKT